MVRRFHHRKRLVTELKNEGFRPEFTGKLAFYVTAVDEMLGGEYDNPTIGLLLCKTKNDVVAEWSLRTTSQIEASRTSLQMLGDLCGLGLPS